MKHTKYAVYTQPFLHDQFARPVLETLTDLCLTVSHKRLATHAFVPPHNTMRVPDTDNIFTALTVRLQERTLTLWLLFQHTTLQRSIIRRS